MPVTACPEASRQIHAAQPDRLVRGVRVAAPPIGNGTEQRIGPHPVTPCNEAVLPLWMSGSPSQLTIGWGVRVAQRESGLTAEPNPPRRAPGVLAMPRASLRRALAVLSV